MANPLESGNFFDSGVKRQGLDGLFGSSRFTSSKDYFIDSYDDLEDLNGSNISEGKTSDEFNNLRRNNKNMV